MKKQTAVEWLIEQIKSNIFCDHIQGIEYWDKDTLIEFLEQAKQMEKEQIIKAWEDGSQSEYQYHVTGEYRRCSNDYYNETYGKQEIEKL